MGHAVHFWVRSVHFGVPRVFPPVQGGVNRWWRRGRMVTFRRFCEVWDLTALDTLWTEGLLLMLVD